MALWLIILYLFFSLAHSEEHHKHIIYVDSVNGVDNTSCWYGGIDMPCKTLFLANQGRQLKPDILIATIEESSSNEESNMHEQSLNVKEPGCLLWMYRDEQSGECKCSNSPYGAVHCDPTIPRTSLLDCYCMTYNTEQNQTQLGHCVYGFNEISVPDYVYFTLPNNTLDLNEFMCGHDNRTSTLCGKCKDGYSPLVYSYELSCMNCTGMNYIYNWIKYVAIAYVPLTFFFLFVVLFKFSGTSPLLRAFITVSQGIACPASIRVF